MYVFLKLLLKMWETGAKLGKSCDTALLRKMVDIKNLNIPANVYNITQLKYIKAFIDIS